MKGGLVLDQRKIELAIGSMLHDIGKMLYRYNDGRNHSTSGADFLKEQKIENQNIIDQVRFHHKKNLENARIDNNSLAYITYWADNVAAGADRRESEVDYEGMKYDKYISLDSVFNVLNNNNQKMSYNLNMVYDDGKPEYPNENKENYSEEHYGRIIQNIRENIKGINLNERYLNSLLNVMESNLTFIPSSSDKSQLVDISLFDHSKVTAALACTLMDYLNENEIKDYKEALLYKGKEFEGKECFLLYSMDISGIQDFIYNVTAENALKTLRSKSFYLEILLEHIIDEILEKLELSRANLIYSGGGHAYLLLANTNKTKELVNEINNELKNWFINNFGIELYVAHGYSACSANTLMDEPRGSYKELFKNVSSMISEQKLSRYTFNEIMELNSGREDSDGRECKVCGRTDNLIGASNGEYLCEFCNGFVELSNGILNGDFAVVTKDKGQIRLPFNSYLNLTSKDEALNQINGNEGYVRTYGINKMYTGDNMSSKLWVGNYSPKNIHTLEQLANSSEGIKKLGVLRADIDNLGDAFIKGFDREENQKQIAGLSRSSTFSRKLSMFFKLHINHILANGEYSINGKEVSKRNISIVYSGGDDVFVIGAWNEVIEFALDLNDSLKKFTQDTLKISAGFGIFPAKYPVTRLAEYTGKLEEKSKSNDGKDSITLFDENNSYKWHEFKDSVIKGKYSLIERYFNTSDSLGNSQLYKILGYFTRINEQDKINLARLAYLLGRMEPKKDASEETKELYSEFSKSIYKWIKNEKDRKETITAVYIYMYMNRKDGSDE